MTRGSKGIWKKSWWRRMEGKHILQGGIKEASVNGKESSYSAHANEKE
jgi:hypothetical protein